MINLNSNKIEIHFFHGFLGLPGDWTGVIDQIQVAFQGCQEGPDIKFKCHSMWDWPKCWPLESEVLTSAESSQWLEQKPEKKTSLAARYSLDNMGQELACQVNNSVGIKKVLIGYSWGGRVLMHSLKWLSEDVIGVFYLASHPGIVDEPRRMLRANTDTQWGDRFINEPWGKVLADWNGQVVFKNDKIRPIRELSEYSLNQLAHYFQFYSLGAQSLCDERLGASNVSQNWLVGQNDRQYQRLKKRLESILGPSRCLDIPQAGHGALWDSPRELAALIVQWIEKNR